ncbi:MAG: hypothetical protein ACRD0W_12540 [Acidimicrobiales bacterium]
MNINDIIGAVLLAVGVLAVTIAAGGAARRWLHDRAQSWSDELDRAGTLVAQRFPQRRQVEAQVQIRAHASPALAELVRIGDQIDGALVPLAGAETAEMVPVPRSGAVSILTQPTRPALSAGGWVPGECVPGIGNPFFDAVVTDLGFPQVDPVPMDAYYRVIAAEHDMATAAAWRSLRMSNVVEGELMPA